MNQLDNRFVLITDSEYYIGQSYGGGKICYIDYTGLHGLIAATGDTKTGKIWGSTGLTIGCFNLDIGQGSLNTSAIIAGDPLQTAPSACAGWDGGGFNDWFLPSLFEFREMRKVYQYIGGFTTGVYYWTSTEHSINHAKCSTVGGTETYTFKNGTTLRTRAIRYF